MESGGFHESFEKKISDIKVTGLNRPDLPAMQGEYYFITGIPTYIARLRRLGSFGSSNFELIKLVQMEEAHVMVAMEGSVYWGRFQDIASTSKANIIREARNRYQNDLMADIQFTFDTQS